MVIIAGCVTAILIDRFESPPADFSNDLAMVGFEKPERRQMVSLYGPVGILILDIYEELGKPGTQIRLVLTVTLLAGTVLIYFGRKHRHFK